MKDIQPYFWPPRYVFYQDKHGDWVVFRQTEGYPVITRHDTRDEARAKACNLNCRQYHITCEEHPLP